MCACGDGPAHVARVEIYAVPSDLQDESKELTRVTRARSHGLSAQESINLSWTSLLLDRQLLPLLLHAGLEQPEQLLLPCPDPLQSPLHALQQRRIHMHPSSRCCRTRCLRQLWGERHRVHVKPQASLPRAVFIAPTSSSCCSWVLSWSTAARALRAPSSSHRSRPFSCNKPSGRDWRTRTAGGQEAPRTTSYLQCDGELLLKCHLPQLDRLRRAASRPKGR